MGTTLVDLLDAALLGGEVLIPGATVPARLARLSDSASLLRLPPGWTRPQHGHHLAGEEFVVLGGELQISGVRYLPGHHGWLPAGALRHSGAAPVGALVLCGFAANSVWVPSDLDEPDGPSQRTPLASVVIPAGGLRLTPRSVLHDTPVVVPHPAEMITVGSWTWERSPLMPEGRVLVRCES
ncbi:hypothetical protein ACWGH8_42655 [Nonomuraea muscovyensis]|uniref:Cupin domain-containing protein n=1 Tax=Nonomuraea muscovyensis TaxID=1124761 RepID=A0A7X0CE01_9ACTN|nr:hypothetical protein [Nonomuraea muscovyensis]MBB6352211.1 hypothetical protein [Nonomuraea muscovyensis]